MTLTVGQEAEVKTVIDRFAAAYRNKDIRGLGDLFSQEMKGYGSGADEIIPGRKEYLQLVERDFTQSTSMELEFPDLQVSGDGRVAWITSFCNCYFSAHLCGRQKMSGRMTLVLVNRGDGWRILQYHFSVPNTAQAPGQAFSGE